ncbi:MAG: hypothetical protein ACXACY_13290 [Candidatus Hodarchaeales archaeon]|jgi:hypothetical protein
MSFAFEEDYEKLLESLTAGLYILTEDVPNPYCDARLKYNFSKVAMWPKGLIIKIMKPKKWAPKCKWSIVFFSGRIEGYRNHGYTRSSQVKRVIYSCDKQFELIVPHLEKELTLRSMMIQVEEESGMYIGIPATFEKLIQIGKINLNDIKNAAAQVIEDRKNAGR